MLGLRGLAFCMVSPVWFLFIGPVLSINVITYFQKLTHIYSLNNTEWEFKYILHNVFSREKGDNGLQIKRYRN